MNGVLPQEQTIERPTTEWLNFYIIERKDPDILMRTDMDRTTLIQLTANSPVNVLTVDVQEWSRLAKHGDQFYLGNDKVLVALRIPRNSIAGPIK